MRVYNTVHRVRQRTSRRAPTVVRVGGMRINPKRWKSVPEEFILYHVEEFAGMVELRHIAVVDTPGGPPLSPDELRAMAEIVVDDVKVTPPKEENVKKEEPKKAAPEKSAKTSSKKASSKKSISKKSISKKAEKTTKKTTKKESPSKSSSKKKSTKKSSKDS